MHDQDDHHRRKWRPFTGLRNNFLAGLVVVAPIAVTMWLIWTFVGWIDSWVLPFVPAAYQPNALIDWLFGDSAWFKMLFGEDVRVNVRGLGVVVFLIFTVLVGWITKGLIGRSFLSWGEGLVDRMPVVRSLYNGLKQIAETVFSQSTDTKFDKACLVEYPRKGIWAIAFISTKAKGEVDMRIPVDEDIISVFLPTTPNPTSGFLLFVPRHSVIELDMSVEDAAKLVISAGWSIRIRKIPASRLKHPAPNDHRPCSDRICHRLFADPCDRRAERFCAAAGVDEAACFLVVPVLCRVGRTSDRGGRRWIWCLGRGDAVVAHRHGIGRSCLPDHLWPDALHGRVERQLRDGNRGVNRAGLWGHLGHRRSLHLGPTRMSIWTRWA